MSIKKKAVSLIGMSPKIKEFLEAQSSESKAAGRGVGGDKMYEPIPSFLNTPAEKVISSDNNSWIVLGRDRVASKMSGYGGKGDTQAASIDLVAGRMGSEVAAFNRDGDDLWVNPSFKKDAARIYMSQKSDIDKYFDLSDGTVGNAITKSGIAIKADGVRIIGREGIKLVTNTDMKNSQGGDIKSIVGIDLIAGNDDSDIQPLPKGENLAEALDRIVEHIDKLNGIVDSMLMAQFEMNEAVSTHYHTSPFFASPTMPSETCVAKGIRTMVGHLQKTKTSLLINKANLAMFRNNYLKPSGDKYINSRFNHTN